MTDLAAIVRATRASANALKRAQRSHWEFVSAQTYKERIAAYKRHERDMRTYQRAQEILRTNPLPGDDVSNTD